MRHLVKKSYWLSCLYYLGSDAWWRLRHHRGAIDSDSGVLHGGLDVSQSLDYIGLVFDDYKRYAGVDTFRGRVAELGPGDNCGVALLFLAGGCESVDLADRFYTRRNAALQAHVYRALGDRVPAVGRLLRDARLEDEATFPGVTRWHGPAAAGETFFEGRAYDCIVSRAVLEHLYDPLEALRRMAIALRPGGVMLHKVDLRDHGMFSTAFDELKFLQAPAWLHRAMTGACGRPNRVLVHRYRQCLDGTGLSYGILVTCLAGVGDVVPHLPYEEIPAGLRERACAHVRNARSHMAPEFARVSDEDLSVTGIFIVARKDAAAPDR